MLVCLLLLNFSNHYKVIGYDLNKNRIDELKKSFDRTKEVNKDTLLNSKNITFYKPIRKFSKATIFIVTFSPIDKVNKPDFRALKVRAKQLQNI